EKLEEDLVTYLKYFHESFESFDDSTNVVNAPREPFIVKQDHGVKSSQNPPPVDKCCCEYGNALDGIFCQQCICKSCGKGAHTGYNCPPKKQEEKRIEEEQAANARYWKIPACCDDDDDYDFAITPILSTEETENSLSMGDEHLDTISAMESDEVIKSSVEDLVPIPSEFEGENGCDVPSCFTTFSNILFDTDYDFESIDDQSLVNEDVLEKIFSNPLFKEEIISIKKNQHHFNAESDLVESMLNRDSLVISSSSKIDSLLKSSLVNSLFSNQFRQELIKLSVILRMKFVFPRDCCMTIHLLVRRRNLILKILMLKSNLFLHIDDDNDSEGDNIFLERLLQDDHIPFLDTLDFSNVVRVFLPFFTYPVTSSILHPFGNEDTIFDPGITINHFYSFKPGLSHRCGTFKKFNTHRSHLNESPMEMLFSTCSPMDQ
nr:hypothetical protein [Tanacetum cinerariifolium]